MKNHQQKVAIVHDWLYGGGAERVVLELHRMFPDAPIYTSYCTDEWRQKLDNKVITGWLQRWPFSTLRKFIPVLRIWWFTHLDLSGYDLVISSSGNGEAKGIKVPNGTKHICYCHTPTHFYWRHYDQYMNQPGFGVLDPVARLGLKLLVQPLRRWDYKAAQHPDIFIANSEHIKNDIQTFYNRDAVVVHPPIDIERFSNMKHAENRHGFITVGRQVPYKHTEIIIEACNKLKLPLMVVGNGPEHAKLQKLAGPTITLRTDVTDQELPKLMAQSEAFIFAAFEDFGITPVEAMAAGTPVIAYKAGGALDYVTEGITGSFFHDQTVTALTQCLEQFKNDQFKPDIIRAKSRSFSAAEFQVKLRSIITEN